MTLEEKTLEISLLQKTLNELDNLEDFLLLYYRHPQTAREMQHSVGFTGVWNPWQGYLTLGSQIVSALDKGWTTVARYLIRTRRAKAKCYQDIAYYESDGNIESARWWSH